MEEVALKDLDTRLQKQIENARKAVDKNPTYAVDILTNIVSRNHACLDARKILRQAQQRATKGKTKGLGGLLSKVTSLPFSMSSDAKIKKNPQKAMDSAEQILNSNPDNVTGHKILGAAAEELELYSTAVFAYEAVRQLEPSNSENIKALMGVYIKTGNSEEAIRIGEAAYRANPADDEVQSLIKKASVEQTMEKGKWEEDKSFREKLKDEDESQKLEQAGRAKTGDAGLRALIEEAKRGVAETPENMNFYREIASNYRKLGEYDNALEWVAKARELEAGRADVNLERLVGTLKREKMQKAIAEVEARLEGNPEDAAAIAELERLRTEERTFRLEQCEDLVQRYPNEYGYRYELGELYFEDGETDKAIKELQMAQRSPKVRVGALILLGKAYLAKGFHDLAAEQLTTAKSEIPGMTDQKKDVLYQLGSAYEQQGDMDKAMVEFKALYGADISYRDVAQKIDDFYSK
ncbi:tetratricopeptide repeat protein [Coraliomargarita sp. SDUM461004]|uniref:Tetratricopeptide repeat protein n=1 Tax=Thalassobacterium sedimentorum TaxID=3041258 RepID=A0ABU1AEC9_9BACT|nr:tetratricopeptide repeat protein [Coraliomargarita sp. SDUM461004]MDQ8193048.1 tetratricopeptide repeat protein [Coraliomargarita sp. SDUM461004]